MDQAVETARAATTKHTMDLVLDVELCNGLLRLVHGILLGALATLLVKVLAGERHSLVHEVVLVADSTRTTALSAKRILECHEAC